MVSQLLVDRANHHLLSPTRVSASMSLAMTRPLVRSFETIEEREVRWLWRDHVPFGMLTMLGALPGTGKSTLTTWLAAMASRGGALPDGSTCPKTNTLMMSAEDSAEYSTRARLRVHGADLSRVFELQSFVDENGDERFINIREHTDIIREVIERHQIGLVVVDPVSSFMPKTDRNDEGSVRDALGPLSKLIEDTGVALIAVVHVGKSSEKRHAQQLVMGSTAFTAMARSVLMTADIPGDSSTGENRKVLAVVKSNIAPKPAPLAWSRALDEPIKWHGISTVTFEDAAMSTPGRASETLTEQAKELILERTKGGSVLSSELDRIAESRGISSRTFRNARSELSDAGLVESFKEKGPGGRWYIRRLDTIGDATLSHEGKAATTPYTNSLPSLHSLPPSPLSDGSFAMEECKGGKGGNENHVGNLAALPLDEELF